MMNDSEKEQLLVNLFTAYFEARKNKRNTINQLRFEINYESQLINLWESLINRTYKLLPSIAFIVEKPVKREVLAADFRDRVVHHLLFDLVSPVFEATFIPESFSCRKGKGTHYGIRTLYESIERCSNFYKTDCFVLKMDIKGYFMSINKNLLSAKLHDKIKHSTQLTGSFRSLALYIIDIILSDDPTKNCIIRGVSSDWSGLPPTKSLFHAQQDCGLPIGNLTSQLFSNIYLDEFDHYVKESLGFEYYGRYVDDFYLVHNDEQYLKRMIPVIREYLWRSVKLELHPNKIYLQHYTRGINFLGATLKPGRIYVSRRTRTNFILKISDWAEKLNGTAPSRDELVQLRSSVNSYLGIMKHYRTFNIRKRVLLGSKNQSIFKFGYLQWSFRKPMNFFIYRKYPLTPPPPPQPQTSHCPWPGRSRPE
jgi:retron-type reverse transcriptase